MRSERDEPVRLEPVTAAKHFHDRGLEVVVTDAAGNTTEVFERANVTIEEHFLRFVHIRAAIPTTRRREPHHEQRHLTQHASEIHADRPEIDFGLCAQQMGLGDRDLRQRQSLTSADLRDVTPHR
ncbi:MAG: hypothetical protein FD127_4467 [Acidimicrobiaceae bacterium]|nr:MAG: hypothetical protein FD127_4467 [Acidimicrobiaceae bacterium]